MFEKSLTRRYFDMAEFGNVNADVPLENILFVEHETNCKQ